jgi:hypothetical protein
VRAVNTRVTSSFVCKLKRGSYKVWVYATDAAGHTQSKITTALLTVK